MAGKIDWDKPLVDFGNNPCVRVYVSSCGSSQPNLIVRTIDDQMFWVDDYGRCGVSNIVQNVKHKRTLWVNVYSFDGYYTCCGPYQSLEYAEGAKQAHPHGEFCGTFPIEIEE